MKFPFIACLLAVAMCCGVARGQVAITEFMAANSGTLADEQGEFSDWIEIHNGTPTSVDLANWFLTDSPARLTKWQFPTITLPPDAYVVVFASEKNRREPGAPLHTNFKLASDGEYLALVDSNTNVVSEFAPVFPRQVADVSFGFGSASATVRFVAPQSEARIRVPIDDAAGTNWISPDFDDAAWTRGAAAVGFEDAPADYAPLIKTDVRPQMAGRNGSCYVRVPFVVTNLTALAGWKLRVQYDDGFVAWINGEEVARRNAPLAPVWDSFATANHPDSEAVLFEEFDLAAFQDWIVTGTNWLALHGMNLSLGSSDFLTVAVIEAERSASQQQGLRYFLTPTPGEPNRGGTLTVGPLILDVKHTPAIPDDAQDLVVTAKVAPAFAPVTSVDLHYRVMFGTEIMVPLFDDGAHGDGAAGDSVYGAIIPANAAAAGEMLRYRITARDQNDAESRMPLFLDPLDSEEYFGTVVSSPNVQSALPVMELFVQNTSAADTRTGTRCALFYLGELYDNVEIRLHGQSSSGFPKKSYNLDFNRGHRFQYQTNATRVKDIKLLTNWGDKSRVRNTLAYEYIRESGSVGHFAFPIRVQRNGQFHGILDLVEDADDRWLSRVGRDPNGALYKVYNSLNSAGGSEKKTRKEENSSDLQSLVDNLNESRPLSARVLYAWDNIDLPQTVSYFVALALISSQDHGHKNYFVYRDAPGSGEWTIFPWDVDLSWGRNWTDSGGYFTDTLYQNNVLTFYNSTQQNKPANRLYDLMFAHPDFRRMYLRRLRTVMDRVLRAPGTLATELPIEARIREWMELMDPPGITTSDADLDFAKWGSWGNRNPMRAEAQRIIDIHLPGRRAFLFTNAAATVNGERIPDAQPADSIVEFGDVEFNPASGNQDQEFIQLTNAQPFAVDVSGWRLAGAVEFTFRPGTVLPPNRSLYVSPEVAALRARNTGPRGGQGLFVQGNYRGRLSAWGETIQLIDDAGRIVDAKTYSGSPSPAQRSLRITEIMFNPPAEPGSTNGPQDYEFIELKNIGATPLDLRGVRFVAGIGFTFTNSPVMSLGPGGFALLVKNADAFRKRYGSGFPIAGEFTGSLDNSGEELRLDDAVGEKILEFAYDNAWHASADGGGHSLVIKDANASWRNWDENWRPSSTIGGSPNRDDQPSDSEDSDGDGMSDAWEFEYGFDRWRDDSSEDADNDGTTNGAEFIAGTKPRDAASTVKFEGVAHDSGGTTLTFQVASNRVSRVLFKVDLENPSWSELAKLPASAQNRTNVITDPGATAAARFYLLEITR